MTSFDLTHRLCVVSRERTLIALHVSPRATCIHKMPIPETPTTMMTRVLLPLSTRAILAMAFLVLFVNSFSTTTTTSFPKKSLVIRSAHENESCPKQQVSQFLVATAIFLSTTASVVAPAAFADEFGVETEAPTLFTGESVMVRK